MSYHDHVFIHFRIGTVAGVVHHPQYPVSLVHPFPYEPTPDDCLCATVKTLLRGYYCVTYRHAERIHQYSEVCLWTLRKLYSGSTTRVECFLTLILRFSLFLDQWLCVYSEFPLTALDRRCVAPAHFDQSVIGHPTDCPSGGFDSSVHISEEASNARYATSRGSPNILVS